MPGRHASRRGGRLARAAVPETLRGRVALGPAQVAVVAVLVALGLAVTCWWVVRGQPAEVAAPAVATPAPAPASSAPLGRRAVRRAGAGAAAGRGDRGAAARARSPSTSPARCAAPGIAVLDAGARVVDALEAAGGARPGVDLSGLNLARVARRRRADPGGRARAGGLAASAVPAAGAHRAARWSTSTPPPRPSSRRCPRSAR